MKAPKFPFYPEAAAVVSDDDGHTVAIFFPSQVFESARTKRDTLKKFLVELLAYNGIVALSVSEEDYNE